jgi:hypothetical protein
MSNVSPREILNLTAVAFGVSPEAIGVRRQGRHAATPLSSLARACAVMLIRRHTSEALRHITELIGFDITVGTRLRAAADNFERSYGQDPYLSFCVAEIEDAIDTLHEARLDAMERATASGMAGFAAIARSMQRRDCHAH